MNISDEIDPPNPPLTKEQQAIANSLSEEFIRAIDEELFSHATTRNRKVFMLVLFAMRRPELTKPGLPDVYYAQRVRALVQKGLLVSEGNLDFMQYSEVRLP